MREDGLWGEGPDGSYDPGPSPYIEYLRARGYDGDNPWADYANAGVDEDGNIAPGWFMQHAGRPANIREEDSETPYLTDRAIEFLDEMARTEARPWLCHLSYIKPHWPYIAPAPYHRLYGRNQIQPPVRHPREREDPHPVYGAFMANAIGRAFQRDEVREAVIPAYMGLVKQCDDQLGRLLAHLEAAGRMDDTTIVLTSDHGDYLGDHWLGEKDLFHEPSVKIPCIVYDPSPEADATRGQCCDVLVEGIDLVPTFIELAGGEVPTHVVEGRSLAPLLRGEPAEGWREFVVSEYDYSITPMAARLGVSSHDARLFMIADERWKFVHAEGGFRPMLFDLERDPDELVDLGASADHAPVLEMMVERLGRWARRLSQRLTRSEDDLARMRGASRRRGILIGLYDGSEVDAELHARYRGPARQRHVASEED